MKQAQHPSAATTAICAEVHAGRVIYLLEATDAAGCIVARYRIEEAEATARQIEKEARQA